MLSEDRAALPRRRRRYARGVRAGCGRVFARACVMAAQTLSCRRGRAREPVSDGDRRLVRLRARRRKRPRDDPAAGTSVPRRASVVRRPLPVWAAPPGPWTEQREGPGGNGPVPGRGAGWSQFGTGTRTVHIQTTGG